MLTSDGTRAKSFMEESPDAYAVMHHRRAPDHSFGALQQFSHLSFCTKRTAREPRNANFLAIRRHVVIPGTAFATPSGAEVTLFAEVTP
jgi:hypothetical protein